MRNPPGDAAPIRVLHLTDPHLFADTDRQLRGRITYDCLSRVIAHFRRSGWPADLALVTGDVVQDDSRKAYEHFCRLLMSLQLPVQCIPGNHDVRHLMREVMAQFAIPYCPVTTSGRWLVAGIDSCEEGGAGGRIADREMRRLEAALSESDAPNVLIALHHPPVLVGSRWLDEVGLENADEFLQLAASTGKPTVVLFGHVHQAFDATDGALRILGTPSTCRQFRVGSETFAVDDRPPAYRCVTLQVDGRSETEVVWT